VKCKPWTLSSKSDRCAGQAFKNLLYRSGFFGTRRGTLVLEAAAAVGGADQSATEWFRLNLGIIPGIVGLEATVAFPVLECFLTADERCFPEPVAFLPLGAIFENIEKNGIGDGKSSCRKGYKS